MADQALILLVQQLQQELQNQRIEIQELRADVQTLRSQNQSRPSRSSLPDPPRFDGRHFTLRTWLPSIRAKLRSSHLVGADAFDYVWDRLEQPQQASVLHLRQLAEDNQSWDPEVLFAYFQRLCHNPREHQEAIQRLSTIRQKDEESLVAYLARFERLVFEAEASSWPEVTRITTFHRGLRSTLRHLLEESEDSLFTLPYDSYIELAQRLDRRGRRPQNQNPVPSQKPFQKPSQKPPQKPTPSPEPMDIAPIHIAAIRPRPCSPARSTSPASSASSSARHQHRAKHDLCFYCGSPDHWISSCPGTPANSPPPSPRPRTKTTARSATIDRLYRS